MRMKSEVIGRAVAANWRSQPAFRSPDRATRKCRKRQFAATREPSWALVRVGAVGSAAGLEAAKRLEWVRFTGAFRSGSLGIGRKRRLSARSPNAGASCGCPHAISISGGRGARRGREICVSAQTRRGTGLGTMKTTKQTGQNQRGGRREKAREDAGILRLLRFLAAAPAFAGR